MNALDTVAAKGRDGGRFTDGEVTPDLMRFAGTWLKGYAGDFPFLVSVRANATRAGKLTKGQARGVLNCMVAEGRYAHALVTGDARFTPPATIESMPYIEPNGGNEPDGQPAYSFEDYTLNMPVKTDPELAAIMAQPVSAERGAAIDDYYERQQATFDVIMFEGLRGVRATKYFNNAQARLVMAAIR